MALSFKERHNKCIIQLLLQYPKEELTAKEIFSRSNYFKKSEQVGRRMIDLQRLGCVIDGVTYYVEVAGVRDGLQAYKITFAPSEIASDTRITRLSKHLKQVLNCTNKNDLKGADRHFECAKVLLFSMQPKVCNHNQVSIFEAVNQ